MIKNALTIYRKNIWNVFAILGFLCLGLLIGLFVVLPVINNSIFITYNKIISCATSSIVEKLDVNKFFTSLTDQLNKLDWASPIRCIKILFENNGLLKIVEAALKEGGISPEFVKSISGELSNILRSFGSTTMTQISILIGIIFVISIIGYLSTKIVIQINSTKDRNILRFIGSFLLNFIALAGMLVLLLISLITLKGVGLFFAIVAIFILMLICTLIISIICYKKKDIKLFDILNLKNVLYLFLSSLIVFGISFVILLILYFISDLVALLLSIPLIIITTIIVENIVVADITDKYYLNK